MGSATHMAIEQEAVYTESLFICLLFNMWININNNDNDNDNDNNYNNNNNNKLDDQQYLLGDTEKSNQMIDRGISA